MDINTRNYAQKTNYKCGTDIIDILPFYVTTLNIPSIETNISEISGRFGTTMNIATNTLQFSALDLTVLLDEDYLIYKEIVNNLYVNIDDGTFSAKSFNFWTEVTNDMGKTVMKIEYFNCYIESIGALELASNDDITEQTFNITIKYDYFKIVNNKTTPTLKV